MPLVHKLQTLSPASLARARDELNEPEEKDEIPPRIAMLRETLVAAIGAEQAASVEWALLVSQPPPSPPVDSLWH
jgi:hypothetical protein